MRILCVYQGPDMPSSRIRVLDMLPHLEKEGVSCQAAPYPKRLLDLRVLTALANGFDLVWLQKRLPSPAHRLFWRRVRAPLVFDFDDAICFRKEPKRGSYHSRTRRSRFERVLRLSRAATCGNEYLASLIPLREMPVLLYPSPVPDDGPQRDYGCASGPLRVGWIGGGGNLASLESIAPALRRVHREQAFVLTVISDRAFHCEGLEVANVSWSLEGQGEHLAGLDLGLMPLDGASPFDRGKCSYKVLQYMAAGVAAAADAVGMNREVIRDGVNGRLVGDQGWEAILLDLLGGGRERLAPLGAEGRRTVESRYTYAANAGRLGAFFRSVVDRRKERGIA